MLRHPDISSRQLAEKTGWSLQHAWKMKKIIVAERAEAINADVQRDVAQFSQTIQELCSECWFFIENKETREIYDKDGEVIGVIPKVSDSDKLRAIEILGRNLKMVLDVKFDAGIFKKQLGEMDIKSFNVFVDLVKVFAQNGTTPNQPAQDNASPSQPDSPALPTKPQ
jgi:5-methylcytosine-specific restriction endonuclease McrBC regulatory subunit McrC